MNNDNNTTEVNAVSPFVTIEKTAAMFDVELCTLYAWKRKGYLMPFKIGGRVYYRMSDILAIADQPVKN